MKILLGYEDTEVGRTALELTVKHAKINNAKVFIVISMVGGGDVPEDTFLDAEKILKKAKGRCDAENIDCETRLVVRGMTPGEDLIRFAEEKGINEIIIGTKRKSKLGKLLFGSNAQYIILNAPCPVVTVRAGCL